jgi:excisionase family DNA binding protein
MVQGYYTVDEAARILGMAADELSQMARKGDVRAFADRGTWRFRTQDIEELARRRGLGSSPDLPLGEAPPARPHDSPTPKAMPPSSDEDFLDFPLGPDSDQVEIGQEIVSGSSSGMGGKSSKVGPPSSKVSPPSSKATPAGGSKVGPPSSKATPGGGSKVGPPSSKATPAGGSKVTNKTGPKSPPPKPGSDSDVRLVADGSDLGLSIASDSDVKLEDSGPKSKSRPRKSGPKQDSGSKIVMEGESDSDVKIVPDSSSDVDVLGGQTGPKGSTDSDVRLEQGGSRKSRGPEDSFLTEEIDLDEELRRAQESARPPRTPPAAKTPPQAPPSSSPFELSDADLVAPKGDSLAPSKSEPDSSDFDLSLESGKDLSPLELSSGEVVLDSSKADDEVSLGEISPPSGTVDSGINLQEPADSGISLEQGGDASDEIEFELSLDAESTPKPAKAAPPNVDSSSEFELTLEDSAGLAPLEEEAPTEASAEEEGEKDIFETDFDVPALDDESGSQVAALDESDTDLESSDFDLALGEEDAAAEDESGSQVVALEDEEEVDEGAATIARPRRGGGAAVAEGEEEVGDLLSEEELVAEAPEAAGEPRRVLVAAPPADWGIFTPVVLLVSVLVMFFVGIMSFELVRGMWGYHQPTKVTSPIIRAFGGMFYDSKSLPPD